MDRFAVAWMLSLGLVGCSLTNGAYDGEDKADGETADVGDGESGKGESSEGESSESESSESSESETSESETSGESGEELDTGFDEGWEDTGEMCGIQPMPPLALAVGHAANPNVINCPSFVARDFKYSEGVMGDIRAQECPQGCDECWEEPNDRILSIAPLHLDSVLDLEPGECIYVEAEGLIPQDVDGPCMYRSLAIYLGFEGIPWVAAVRDDAPLTVSASDALLGWAPGIYELGACSCDDPEIDCCANNDLATVSDFFVEDNFYAPPATVNVEIADLPFTFHGQQAQSGFACGVEDEVSWALVAY